MENRSSHHHGMLIKPRGQCRKEHLSCARARELLPADRQTLGLCFCRTFSYVLRTLSLSSFTPAPLPTPSNLKAYTPWPPLFTWASARTLSPVLQTAFSLLLSFKEKFRFNFIFALKSMYPTSGRESRGRGGGAFFLSHARESSFL